jgi:hypothetical protein
MRNKLQKVSNLEFYYYLLLEFSKKVKTFKITLNPFKMQKSQFFHWEYAFLFEFMLLKKNQLNNF